MMRRRTTLHCWLHGTSGGGRAASPASKPSPMSPAAVAKPPPPPSPFMVPLRVRAFNHSKCTAKLAPGRLAGAGSPSDRRSRI